MVLKVINSAGNELMGPNLSLFAPPKELELSHPNITIKSVIKLEESIFQITLHSDKMALYVVLSCQVEGQFQDNAFIIKSNEEKVCLYVEKA